jgi:hypothetical protein
MTRRSREGAKRRTPAPGRPRFVDFVNTSRGGQWLAALLRRVGETPAQRLRWIVNDFLRLDLALLTPGELAPKGDDLRAAALFSLPSGVVLHTKLSPMPPGVLRRYQVEIDQGLRAVLGTDGEWPLSGRPVLQRQEAGFRIVVAGDEKAGILGGIAALVAVEVDRLKTCKDRKCGAPFIAIKRQEYCTIKHSQRERNRIRLDRERAEMEKGAPHG